MLLSLTGIIILHIDTIKNQNNTKFPTSSNSVNENEYIKGQGKLWLFTIIIKTFFVGFIRALTKTYS